MALGLSSGQEHENAQREQRGGREPTRPSPLSARLTSAATTTCTATTRTRRPCGRRSDAPPHIAIVRRRDRGDGLDAGCTLLAIRSEARRRQADMAPTTTASDVGDGAVLPSTVRRALTLSTATSRAAPSTTAPMEASREGRAGGSHAADGSGSETGLGMGRGGEEGSARRRDLRDDEATVTGRPAIPVSGVPHAAAPRDAAFCRHPSRRRPPRRRPTRRGPQRHRPPPHPPQRGRSRSHLCPRRRTARSGPPPRRPPRHRLPQRRPP